MSDSATITVTMFNDFGSTTTSPRGVEVRRNPDGTLDEVVARNAYVHLEQMDDDLWCLIVNDVVMDIYRPNWSRKVNAFVIDPESCADRR